MSRFFKVLGALTMKRRIPKNPGGPGDWLSPLSVTSPADFLPSIQCQSASFLRAPHHVTSKDGEHSSCRQQSTSKKQRTNQRLEQKTARQGAHQIKKNNNNKLHVFFQGCLIARWSLQGSRHVDRVLSLPPVHVSVHRLFCGPEMSRGLFGGRLPHSHKTHIYSNSSEAFGSSFNFYRTILVFKNGSYGSTRGLSMVVMKMVMMAQWWWW